MPTITLNSIQYGLVVEFDYQRAERRTREHPGCDEAVDITAITVNGVDVFDLIESLRGVKKIEEAVLEAYREQMQDAADDAAIEAHIWAKGAA